MHFTQCERMSFDNEGMERLRSYNDVRQLCNVPKWNYKYFEIYGSQNN